ncbi:MAG TPA: 4-hydroxy-tetrahydrodipicolinate reductase [Polyangiales bacterium]
MALKVGVHGAGGRMGRSVVQLVHEAEDLTLVAAVDAEGSPLVGRDAGELAGVPALGIAVSARVEELAHADVVVDFSLPVALPRLFAFVEKRPLPLVIATTGLDADLNARIDVLARSMPLIAAPNYSTGVAVLYHLAEKATALLADFDLEIIEMHHRHKVDAPSGTALGLLDAAARGRDVNGRELAVYGRKGHTGARNDREIGVMTLRGGDVFGDHTLMLAGPGERLELTHRASSRALFARGALRAARYVATQKPGRYGMPQVLGLAP